MPTYYGLGWVQENGQYESFGSDKDIVSVSKDSNWIYTNKI